MWGDTGSVGAEERHKVTHNRSPSLLCGKQAIGRSAIRLLQQLRREVIVVWTSVVAGAVLRRGETLLQL